MVSETVLSVQRDDPAHGDWCAEGQELNVWVDASSLVIGVALERYKAVLEDVCWLRPENDAEHINLAKLSSGRAECSYKDRFCVCVPLGIRHPD